MGISLTYARLKTRNGSYISTVGSGPSAVGSTGQQSDAGSRFLLVDRNGDRLRSGDKINLLSYSGYWVCAELGGSKVINANRCWTFEWEEFVIVLAGNPSSQNDLRDGDSVAILTSKGQLLLEAGTWTTGTLKAEGTTINLARTFTLELAGAPDPNKIITTGEDAPDPLGYYVEAVRSYVKGHDISTCVIAIFKDGNPKVLHGYGYLDRNCTQLTIPSTMMLMGSIDKHVTNVAIEKWMAPTYVGWKNLSVLPTGICKQTKFFPFLRSLGVQPQDGHSDARLDKITFQHMLSGMSGLNTAARPNTLRTAEDQARWAMAYGYGHDAGTVYCYPNMEYDLLRFAIFRALGGRDAFVNFLKTQVMAGLGNQDIDLMPDDPNRLNPREPWYRGSPIQYPNWHLWPTASAEALGCLFSRYRQGDGRPIGIDIPVINAIRITTVDTAPSNQRYDIKINCGDGGGYSYRREYWNADRNFQAASSGVFSTNSPINGAARLVLYMSQRTGALRYAFSVPDGVYIVTLMFAELYHNQPGKRSFSLAINDDTVLSDFDIVREAGAPLTAVDRAFHIRVEDNKGITISASPSWGAETWFGGLSEGATAMVYQDYGQGIVNVYMFNTPDPAGGIDGILNSDSLIGRNWP